MKTGFRIPARLPPVLMMLEIMCAKGGAMSSGEGKYPPVMANSVKETAMNMQNNAQYQCFLVKRVVTHSKTAGKDVPGNRPSVLASLLFELCVTHLRPH